MKVALAQVNATVGDLSGNEAKILEAYRRGVEAGAEIVVFPELAIAGYPPRDLLQRSGFIRDNLAVLERLAAATRETGMLVGYVGLNEARPGREATNAVALLQGGKVLATRTKTLLPTYDVFDERRYFEPGESCEPVLWNGRRVGVTICEDIWTDESLERPFYDRDPVVVADLEDLPLVRNKPIGNTCGRAYGECHEFASLRLS